MRVLITGGAGYIGSHTNKLFREKGIETIILDDLSDGHLESVEHNFIQIGDFGNIEVLDKIMSNYSIDAVIHFGAFASVPDSVINPSKYYENNVAKMRVLLDACVKYKIKYFVFSSSAATFGEPQYLPIDEEHPQNPINPYGYTKLIGERMLADYEKAYGIKYCALRYFCAAGDSPDGQIGEAHNPETHLIPVMVKAALNGNTLKVFGNDYDTCDGSCIRDFIHVMDLAEAHLLGLEYIINNNCSECFNLGSGTGFTILEMIHNMNELGYPVNYEIVGRRPGDPPSLVASNSKARRLLNWEPKYSDIKLILADAIYWEQNRRY